METRLKPIEKPSSIMMKLIYFFSRKQFGKVLTPLSVLSARMPASFAFATQKLTSLSNKLSIGRELSVLLQMRVAQINVCEFCMDISKAKAIKELSTMEKAYQLADSRNSTLFTPAEKAALQFVEELTLNKRISDETFENAKRYFNERQLVEIGWLVSLEHYYNMSNIAFNITADNLCDIKMKGKAVSSAA